MWYARVTRVTAVSGCPCGRWYGFGVPDVRSTMPKYVVTGGEDGKSGIEVDGKRYEPGETVEIATGSKDWRIAAGYLELASKSKRARDDNGYYVADDPETPENEAFEPDPAPKKAGGK